MIRIGLTGSIGMGKTQVGKLFAQFGIPVIESDDIVHTLYTSDAKVIAAISQLIPSARENGIISRTKLAAHLETHPQDFEKVERIVHPAVQEYRRKSVQQFEDHLLIVYVIPLLFETDAQKEVDITIVVSCPPEIQSQRVRARPGMTKEKFQTILHHQMPDAVKRQKADYVIPTDEPLTQTIQRVRDIVSAILKKVV